MAQEPVNALPHPDVSKLALVEILRALADPLRLNILRRLAQSPDQECTCGDFGLPTKQLATHHLRILREAGLTLTREQGRHRFVQLRRAELAMHFPQVLALILSTAETTR